MARATVVAVLLAVTLAGCGGSGHHARTVADIRADFERAVVDSAAHSRGHPTAAQSKCLGTKTAADANDYLLHEWDKERKLPLSDQYGDYLFGNVFTNALLACGLEGGA